jgi:hypothetical protein
MEVAFWLIGAYAHVIQNNFEVPKNSKIKFLVYIVTFYVRTQVSWENNISCGMYKKYKKLSCTYSCWTIKILHEKQKIFFS